MKKLLLWSVLSALIFVYTPPPVAASSHVEVLGTEKCFFGLFNCTRTLSGESRWTLDGSSPSSGSPGISSRSSSSGNGIIRILGHAVLFINYVIIPFLFALAFIFFIVNAFRFFIFKGDTEDGRKNAGQLALYGILAFVILVSIWGIVNLLVQGFGIDRDTPVLPDYVEENRDPWEGLR